MTAYFYSFQYACVYDGVFTLDAKATFTALKLLANEENT